MLSAGIPPSSFSSSFSQAQFEQQVEAWLALRHESSALIVAPGDQLPPDGDLDRVTRMVEMAAHAGY